MSVRSFKEKKSLEISFYSDIRSHTLTLVFVCFKFRLVCLFVWLDKTRIVKPLGRFHQWRLATQRPRRSCSQHENRPEITSWSQKACKKDCVYYLKTKNTLTSGPECHRLTYTQTWWHANTDDD